MTDPEPKPEAKKVKVVVAPERPPEYLAIDGTLVGDAAKFAWLMEQRGHFVNVLDSLPAVPGETGRLDPGKEHAYLPIHRLKLGKIANPSFGKPEHEHEPAVIDNVVPTDALREGVAVVCPSGLNGFGKDRFWKKYREGDDEDGKVAKVTWDSGYTSYGRHTALERSARLLQRLMLCPGVSIERKADGTFGSGHLLVDLLDDRDGFVRTADLVFLSSHGYLGGFMVGDRIQGWPEAEPAFVPGKAKGAARDASALTSLFSVGKVLKSGGRFDGPRWLVFALCSAVNEATWASWVKIFERSVPQVRGVLAYEEVAPDAGIANKITETFFERLDAGDPLLDAWRTANATHKTEGQPTRWAAIVHDDARKDTLAGWASLPELGPERTSATSGLYRGYHSPVAKEKPTDPEPDATIATEGRPVRDVPPAFSLTVEHDVQGFPWSETPLSEQERGWHEIVPEHLDEALAFLQAGERFRLTIAPSEADQQAGVLIESVRLEMIHIRPTKPRIPWLAVWKAEDAAHPIVDPRAATTSLESGKALLEVKTKPDAANPSLVLSLRARAEAGHPDVVNGHSYFWFRIELVGDDKKTRKHDFMMQGILY